MTAREQALLALKDAPNALNLKQLNEKVTSSPSNLRTVLNLLVDKGEVVKEVGFMGVCYYRLPYDGENRG